MAHKKKNQTLKLIKYFLQAYPLRSAVILIALILAGIVETIGIGALLPLLNTILGTEGETDNKLSQITIAIFNSFGIQSNLTNLLLIIMTAISFKALVTFQAMKLVAYSAADITQDFREQLITALLSAKWQYFSTLPIGKSANSIATEAESAGYFFTLTGKTIASSLQCLIYIGIAFIIDWKISIAAIFFGGILAYILKFLVRMARDSGNAYTNSLNKLISLLSESLSGAKPLKAMGVEKRFTELLAKDISHINVARKKQGLSYLALQTLHEPILVIFISIGIFIMFTYTSYPVTELLIIAFLFHRLMGYLNQVQSSYQKTAGYEAAVNSILESIGKANTQCEKVTGTKTIKLKNEIKLENITLSYGDNIICKNLNETIPANKITAIFGPSGIGKSTLLDAILVMMEPKKGRIIIDGTPLTEINIQDWRNQIGYVPQETFLFHDSISSNVSIADKTIEESDIIDALKKSSAWNFIENLEGKLNHIVGERGGKLSGGQKQRIALARALVRKPKILILDEATTGLDKESEKEILQCLQNMLPDITIIAISHDPKILDIADHVIRLENQN